MHIKDGLTFCSPGRLKKWAELKSYDGKQLRLVCQEINLKSDFVVIERKSGLLAIQVRILCVLQ